MRGALQEQRLACDAADILGAYDRLRHAGEGGELVDHAADVADMAHDRVRALAEGLWIG